MIWPKPEADEIRKALRRYAPWLADAPVEFMAEGWSLWAFRAGDYVLRFPKRAQEAPQLEQDRRLLPELARHVSVPLPFLEIYGDSGPNGAPFAGHRYVPGVSLFGLVEAGGGAGYGPLSPGRLAPNFGREFGDFLRELHAFPPQRALELGVPLRDGPADRKSRAELYEAVIRQVFPLISCEARMYTESRFEAFLNDAANFDFQPRLIHNDLDRQNTLADPVTGRLAGVIDWGDAVVGNPACDLWMPLIDFEALGIAGQVPAFLEAYGPLDMERTRVVVDFIQFLWPFHDMLYGLSIGEQGYVEDGIKALNESLPRDLRC